MPTANAYIPEAALATKYGVVRSASSHSLDSKSSENSEKLHSESTPTSRLDSAYDSLHSFLPTVKDRKSFHIRRSSIHKLGDFPSEDRAYYSDFYDSTEQLPADKKCMNFYKRNAYSTCSSGGDSFKTLAVRRFSLNSEVLRKGETCKYVQVNRFSLDDIDSYRTFHQSFSDWNDYFVPPASTQKSVGFEENTPMRIGHFAADSSGSLSSSSSSADSDYDQCMRKSMRNYFKSRVNRDSTSSLCTSHSSSYAAGSFPEEIVDPFERSDEADEPQRLNSPRLGNCQLPLHPSLLNIRSTEAEQTLVNLGFCDPSGIIPARFFPDCTKQENGEAPGKASKGETQDNPQNSKEVAEDISSKNKKDTEVDGHVEHLLMNKNDIISSGNKTNSKDFEEINKSTVHVLNNNKHVFYKQKSIHDEIEEANRNKSSITIKNIPEEESPFRQNAEPNKKNCDQHQAGRNCGGSSFEKSVSAKKGEAGKSMEECFVQNSSDHKMDAENTFYSTMPNIVVSNKISISKISEKSRESFEIASIFGDNDQQSADLRTKTKKEKDSNEEALTKNMDKSLLNSCSFLLSSCTSSPSESPLTVIEMSLQDNKDRIGTGSEEYIKNRIGNSQSSFELDSDDTVNNILDDQIDEVFAYNSNFQEDSSNFSHSPPSSPIKASGSSPSDINNSGMKEHHPQNNENCCLEATQLNPYLTLGPDEVTIYKDSSKVNKEENHINKKLSPPGIYTSSFDMFVNIPEKKAGDHQYQSLDERKTSPSKAFPPLVINGIRFAGSEQTQDHFSVRGLGDGENSEDTTERKVFYAAAYFHSDSKIGKTFHCSEGPEKRSEEYDRPIENKDRNCPEHISSRGNKNDRPETKVSKANIIFKAELRNPCYKKISHKVIMKNIDHSKRRWTRGRTDSMSDNEKPTKDSGTQCNLEDDLRKTNSSNDDNINFPIQNISEKHFLKNTCPTATILQMESNGRKMLLNKKETLISAITKKNGSINADFRFLKEEEDAAATMDLSTQSTSQQCNNSNTVKAVLRLHKGSQTRDCGLYTLCKNELNICAKCLHHMNYPCLQSIGK